MNMKRSSDEILFEALVTGDTSRAIENQERRGQGDLVRNEVLPTKCPREQLEALGFVFGDLVDGDPMFTKVTFPDGWKKVATDHSMHTDLVDAQGRKRGGIFYKAAFYDRSAHMHLNRRYSYGTQPINGYGDQYNPNDPHIGFVSDCDKLIWRSERQAAYGDNPEWALMHELEKEAKAWLEDKYPDYANVLAYWNE